MTFVLLQYRRESASAKSDIARLGSINKNKYCKGKLPMEIIEYRISKIMCEIFFNHNTVSIISNFRCLKTVIESLLSVYFVLHQETDDVLGSCSARSSSRFYSVCSTDDGVVIGSDD